MELFYMLNFEFDSLKFPTIEWYCCTSTLPN